MPKMIVALRRFFPMRGFCFMRLSILWMVASVLPGLHASAQTQSNTVGELTPIALNAPNKERGTAFMKTLSDRQSVRTFSTKALTLQDLSDLIWAANGINRPESGKRTAPSAMNKQEIEVYAVFASGTYLYDAKTHVLIPVYQGDLREALADRQASVKEAPVILLLVANMEKVGKSEERFRMMSAADAGIVSQNINLFCAATGLVTVPRAYMNTEVIKKALNLNDQQLLLLNNPVGYAK